jgi:uncharacterized protein
MPLNFSPRRWLKHIKTMKSASRMGVFFPSQARPKPSPFGSSEIPTRGWKRLWEEVEWFRISKHRFESDVFSQSLSILHLTDIHIRKSGDWLDKLCIQVQTRQPDLTVITGDIVTRGWEKSAVEQFFEAIPRGKYGTFAIMGNWEYWSEAKPAFWRPFLEKHNIRLLREEWVAFEGFCVAGTDDCLAGQSNPESWLHQLPSSTIMLTHSPALFPRLVHPKIPLVLAGHTHAGQIRLPKIGAFWVPRGSDHYIAGWYQQEHTHLFVSRGLGWSVAPIRIGAPPEIAWIDIVPKS